MEYVCSILIRHDMQDFATKMPQSRLRPLGRGTTEEHKGECSNV